MKESEYLLIDNYHKLRMAMSIVREILAEPEYGVTIKQKAEIIMDLAIVIDDIEQIHLKDLLHIVNPRAAEMEKAKNDNA